MNKNMPYPTKKQTFTIEDKINYWKQWEVSGISKKKFCLQNKLPSSFYSWGDLVKADLDKKLASPSISGDDLHKTAFLPVHPPISRQMVADTSTIKCLYRSDSGIQLELSMPISAMVNFIEELSNATSVIR